MIPQADRGDRRAQQQARKRIREAFPEGLPPQLRPEISSFRGNAVADAVAEPVLVPGSLFSPHLVVLALEREDGPYRHLDLQCVLTVIQRWREAILSQSNDLPAHIRQALSGHDREGGPMDGPHLAFLPLGFVGHPHADGRLLGMAAVVPGELAPEDRRLVLQGREPRAEPEVGPAGRLEARRGSLGQVACEPASRNLDGPSGGGHPLVHRDAGGLRPSPEGEGPRRVPTRGRGDGRRRV